MPAAAANQNIVFWVDLQVPRNAPPGSYTGIDQAIGKGQQVRMYSAPFRTGGNVAVWDGLLYWSVDYGIYFGQGRQIWKTGYYYTNESGYTFPGEGNFFYPGEEAGTAAFCPSMRLKWLRDGVEDYEYVELLKNCGLESEAKALIAPSP